jgi:hypothetical protein
MKYKIQHKESIKTMVTMSRLMMLLICWIPFIAIGQTDSSQVKNSFVIYPAFGYQPETSVQIGVVGVWALKSQDRSQTDFQRQSTFTPFFLYTFRNQILSELNLDYYFSNGYSLNISPSFFNFPDNYYGIGNDNDPEISENYTNAYLQLQGQFYLPFNSSAFAGLAFDLRETSIRDKKINGLLASDNLIGAEGGSNYGFGPAIKYETRNNVIYPSKGSSIALQTLVNSLGDFDYTSYTVDVRKYFSSRNEKHIFALQVNARLNSGSEIPFYKLPQLGGDGRLRGIANASLYRDKQAVFTQVEYRRNIIWRFGMVAFAGMGDVASKVSNFEISEFKYVVGTGVRFAVLPEQKLNFRFDFGIASGGQTGFYVGMREAF